MLSSISWSQYIAFTVITLTGYYMYLGYKYYRWEILGLIGIKKIEQGKLEISIADVKQQFTSNNPTDYMPKGDALQNEKIITDAFMDEVKAYLYEASPSAPKEEILFALRQIVSKFPLINNPENKVAVAGFILRETEKHYPGFMQEDDLLHIWP